MSRLSRALVQGCLRKDRKRASAHISGSLLLSSHGRYTGQPWRSLAFLASAMLLFFFFPQSDVGDDSAMVMGGGSRAVLPVTRSRSRCGGPPLSLG